MKFSRLSTIQFTDNDFQQKSPLEMPFIPRGESFTIMELAEEFDIRWLTSQPSIPNSIDIVNVRTSIRTTISNTSSAPCTFTGTIPASIRPGVYRAEFLVRNTQPAVSKPFRITSDNQWGCIVGNNTADRYSDGTPSIVGGRLVHFYQYFRRRDFRLSAIENNTFYDDERGTSFSLQNKNYTRYHLEGYAGERTTAAISMLLAGSWSMLTYKDANGNNVRYRLQKSGDLTTEPIGRGFSQFSGDFNGRRQKYIAINYIDILDLGVNMATNDNILLHQTGQPQQRVPTSVFCLPFTNVDIETQRGTLFTVDTAASYKRVTFTSGKIPDNFGRALKKFDVAEIRQSDKITEIGDNVNLSNKSLAFQKAAFTSVHKIGKNVKIGNFDGGIRLSDNAVFDNFYINALVPIFCKNAIFKNCEITGNINIVGTIAELHNCKLDAALFSSGVIKPDALFVGCTFEYGVGSTYKFLNHRLKDCRMIGDYEATTVFDLTDFKGEMSNSFVYQRLSISTNVATSSFKIDSESLHGYVVDSGTYLGSIQRIDGRSLGTPVAKRWTKINGVVAFDYEPTSGIILDNAGVMHTRGLSLTSVTVGETTPAGLLSDIDNNGLKFDLHGDIGAHNLNNVTSNTSVVSIEASYFLQLMQSGGSYFNNVEFSLRINNDLPDGFSYLLFRSRPVFLENLTMTIKVENDLSGELAGRLTDIYPNFNIISV